jgi:hypothetical protein
LAIGSACCPDYACRAVLWLVINLSTCSSLAAAFDGSICHRAAGVLRLRHLYEGEEKEEEHNKGFHLQCCDKIYDS